MNKNKLTVKKLGRYVKVDKRCKQNKSGPGEAYCLDRLEIIVDDGLLIQEFYDDGYDCSDASAALRLLESLKEHKVLDFELITDEKQN